MFTKFIKRTAKQAAKRNAADRIAHAVRCAMEPLEGRAMMANIVPHFPQWTPQGPAPVVGPSTFVSTLPENESVGAVEAIATPPNNANVVFVASINGGVFRTRQALTNPPHWEPLTDREASQSVSALALGHFTSDATPQKIDRTTAPVDVKKLVVYAGYGRFSSAALDGGKLAGVIRSKQGGDPGTWQKFGDFNRLNVRSIVPSHGDGDRVLVAVRASKDRRGGV